jgi:hypothetical protein
MGLGNAASLPTPRPRIETRRLKPAGFSSCHLGDQFELIQRRQSPLERDDSVFEIVTPRSHHPCENRIGRVGSVRHSGSFFFDGNVATKQLNAPIEIADHLTDLDRLDSRGFVCIEMTLLSHALLQNEPFSQISAGLGANKTRDRKKLASGGGRSACWSDSGPRRLPQPLHRELDVEGLGFTPGFDHGPVSIFRVAFEIVPRQLSGAQCKLGTSASR